MMYRILNTRQQGFTLLEVLIGMSLLSVMMVLLFASLRICIQNWDAGEKKIAEVNQLAVVQKFFSRYLQSIRPIQDNFSMDDPVFSFQGDNGNLQFVASMPASAGRMGLQTFRIGLSPSKDSEGQEIKVMISPFFPLMEGEEWKLEEVVVLENVKTLEFNYFGAQDPADPGTWENEWIGMSHLPNLIKVGIEFENGVIWPPFLVAPRNEMSFQTVPSEQNRTGDSNRIGSDNDRGGDNRELTRDEM